MVLPIVMAGGSGTRLWPLSRTHYPKQFHRLAGESTMLQETVIRLDGLGAERPLLVCHEDQRFLAAEQMRVLGLDDVTILLEPEARNTAPAIALAALHASRSGADPILLVLAADHYIRNADAFRAAIKAATSLAEEGRLVTFGVGPDRPETGYGYIRRGEPLDGGFVVDRFAEKPDAETASGFVKSGEYYWNSGMFLFRASAYLTELERLNPSVAQCCRLAMAGARPDLQFVRVDAAALKACPSVSIDYAVMEKTDKAAVAPLDAGWSDIGSWSALRAVQAQDANGNALRGDVITVETRNTLAHADSRLVTLVGVEDLIVVETKDAVLVAHKDKVQQVREIVDQIKASGRREHVTHREVYRPWGHYDQVDVGDRYQVKRITVKPGGKLSLQVHHHRAEHWVVVRGTAKVRRGEETLLLTENQSTYIPLGEVHSLENPGKIPLELIEVQSGAYLGEDDIERFEDIYGRS